MESFWCMKREENLLCDQVPFLGLSLKLSYNSTEKERDLQVVFFSSADFFLNVHWLSTAPFSYQFIFPMLVGKLLSFDLMNGWDAFA